MPYEKKLLNFLTISGMESRVGLACSQNLMGRYMHIKRVKKRKKTFEIKNQYIEGKSGKQSFALLWDIG